VEISVWEGMRAEADARLLRLLLENLIGNAWKFTSRTPNPHIEVGAMRDGARATFFVRDNGAGFDMAYAHQLFGAFQRLHAASEYAGTGIGLATVQRIVHRHGGRVWAEGEVGKGAVFFFTLATGRQGAAEAVPEEDRALG
jgi:light-regulated signal transduction histidine kinase (bacteriophytochrome)